MMGRQARTAPAPAPVRPAAASISCSASLELLMIHRSPPSNTPCPAAISPALTHLMSAHEGREQEQEQEQIQLPPSAAHRAPMSAEDGQPDAQRSQTRPSSESPLPPITWRNWHRQIRWFNLAVVVLTPLLAVYGLYTTTLTTPTVLFSAAYYVFNMIGE